MAEFANPFQGNNPDGNLDNYELIQAIRIDIASELEAVFLYEAHINSTNDPKVIAVLQDIADEEKLHMGQLISLLEYLDPTFRAKILQGESEGAKQILGDDDSDSTNESLKVLESVIRQNKRITMNEDESNISKRILNLVASKGI